MFKNKDNTIIIAGGIAIILLVAMILINRRGRVRTQEELIYEGVTSQSQSTDIESIEQDLMETDLENLDSELQQIEQDLESAY